MKALSEPRAGAPAAIQKVIALRWWRQAVPVPGKAPTLTDPAAYDLGGGESLEVYKGDGDLYRAITPSPS
jgi:hypothetical protein